MHHELEDREVGRASVPRWGVVQRVKNAVIFHSARAALGILEHLPVAVTRWLGAVVGCLGYVLVAGERRKALESLAIAFPHVGDAARRRIARACFAGLGRAAGEVCCMARLDLCRYVEIPPGSRRVIDEALSLGRGLIWVTAHLGNWELLAAGLAARGYDVRPVATPSYDPRFTAMIDYWRRRIGVRTLWRGRDDLATGVGVHGGNPFLEKGVSPGPPSLKTSEIFSSEHRQLAPMNVQLGAEKKLSRSFEDGVRGRNFSGEKFLPRVRAASVVSEALRQGAIVGLLIDQDTRTPGAFVPFFNRPAWTPTGAASLARRTGAPTVTGFISRRAGGGHVIEVENVSIRSTLDHHADDVATTARLTEAIETAIRARPADWVWMHQRWRTTPDDAIRDETEER
jgi:lauroyl/myristoyl acyltransferase